MNIILRIILIRIFLLTSACASLGTKHLSDGHITVTIGDNVTADKRKLKHLRKNEGVEVLHRYVAHRFKKRRVRKSLKIAISINNYRVGYGRDHMGVDVVVTEDGKQLKEFTVLETIRRFSIKRISKSIAKRIYVEIRSL